MSDGWAPPVEGNENQGDMNSMNGNEQQPEEFGDNQQFSPEGAEEKAKKPKQTQSLATKASLRANQLVKNRYKFEQINVNDKEYYILQANSMSFDRILRRSPREVNKRADDYIIPLGKSCTEAIISAYGLSNAEIYNDEQWLRVLATFNSDKSEENTEKVIGLLHSAAYLKYLRVSGHMVNTSDLYELISTIISVNQMDIVNYFYEMVK